MKNAILRLSALLLAVLLLAGIPLAYAADGYTDAYTYTYAYTDTYAHTCADTDAHCSIYGHAEERYGNTAYPCREGNQLFHCWTHQRGQQLYGSGGKRHVVQGRS